MASSNPIQAHGFWAPGIVFMRGVSFKVKAVVITIVFLLPLFGLLFSQLRNQAEDALQARMDSTREHVEIAYGTIVWAHEKEVAGELTRAQAQQLAAQALSRLRYSGEEYFWINDMQPAVVMHPIKPELNGKYVGDLKDPNGLALFKAFVDQVAAQGQGFVPYLWPKPGKERPVEKLSYVKGFKPWGWIVGSGIYIDDLRDAQERRRNVALGVFAAILLVILYVLTSFYKVNKGGLEIVSAHLNQLSAGDLRTRPIDPWGKDEPAMLILELHKVYDSMFELIGRVQQSARELANTSEEISRASVDLSARTESSASSLEEQASAMEEIGSQVAEMAGRTQSAASTARSNAAVAEEGGKIIADVVHTMHDIHASSTKINDIIGVIDAIAFQTNILALNAAVEAARAGEQGRGFAVVAAEVRQLAGRSAEAAKEIKQLISTSVDKISQGAEIVEHAGSTMGKVVDSARAINQYLDEIAGASRQQAAAVEEIVKAIQDLDANTQQNAALVEETSAAAQALHTQADRLTGEIARFRIA